MLLNLLTHHRPFDTHTGIHPAYWPLSSNRGAMYTNAISDALAFAIEPRALRFRTGVWVRGIRVQARCIPPRRSLPNDAGFHLVSQDGSGVRRHVKLGSPHRGLGPAKIGSISATAAAASAELPAWLNEGLEGVRGVRCYSARVLQRGLNLFAALPAECQRRGSPARVPVAEAAPPCDERDRGGWLATNQEIIYRGAWAPLPKDPAKPAKPGITSLSIGDAMELTIDTTDTGSHTRASNEDESTPATSRAPTSTALTVTFLQSYEQVGMVRFTCVRGCECAETTVDTLAPAAQFALMSTSEILVSQAHECRLRLTNVSPVSRGPGGTKVKISELGISTGPHH